MCPSPSYTAIILVVDDHLVVEYHLGTVEFSIAQVTIMSLMEMSKQKFRHLGHNPEPSVPESRSLPQGYRSPLSNLNHVS